MEIHLGEKSSLYEIVQKEAGFLTASAIFTAVRTADMASTVLGVSKIEEISAGFGLIMEKNPILRYAMEELGIYQGATLYGVASAAVLLGAAYATNKFDGGRKVGNLILYLNSVFGVMAAAQNFWIYTAIKDM